MGMGEVTEPGTNDWVSALPYSQILRSITPISELPDDTSNMGNEIMQLSVELSKQKIIDVKLKADSGDVEAALGYGLR